MAVKYGQAAKVLLVAVLLTCTALEAGTNLLLVTVDTLRPDRLSCYGPGGVRTPAVDGLAARGVLFSRAYAHTPSTLPSHANILLGLTPLAHGVSGNSKARVAAAFLTLAEHLKSRGYATGAFIGAFPLDSRFGLDQGFDVYDDAFSRPGLGRGLRRREKGGRGRRVGRGLDLGPHRALVLLDPPLGPACPLRSSGAVPVRVCLGSLLWRGRLRRCSADGPVR